MSLERQPTKNARRDLVYLALGMGIALALAACAPKQSNSQTSGRPACVSLPSYNGVILQVMGLQPEWGLPLSFAC